MSCPLPYITIINVILQIRGMKIEIDKSNMLMNGLGTGSGKTPLGKNISKTVVTVPLGNSVNANFSYRGGLYR